MADKRIDQLTELTTLDAGDLLIAYDVSELGDEKIRKITKTNAFAGVGGGDVTTAQLTSTSGVLNDKISAKANINAPTFTGDVSFNVDNVSITQTPGKYTVDVTGGATTVANNGTVNFSSASGMLVVNNYTNGAITLYLCGGGVTVPVGTAGPQQVGSLTYNVGIGGYTWTNNSGAAVTLGFFFLRTRPTA